MLQRTQHPATRDSILACYCRQEQLKKLSKLRDRLQQQVGVVLSDKSALEEAHKVSARLAESSIAFLRLHDWLCYAQKNSDLVATVQDLRQKLNQAQQQCEAQLKAQNQQHNNKLQLMEARIKDQCVGFRSV